MKFKATEEQVRKIVQNAVNASIPVGMGFLHHAPGEVPLDKIAAFNGVYSFDYFQGRMVKLRITPNGEDWEITKPHDEPRHDYQSWALVYPTKALLVASVLG